MENDLIRRSDLLAKKCLIRGHLDTGSPCPSKVKAVPVDVIEREPAVDAVEVVRCGECKYYIRGLMSPGSGWCECLERGEYEKHFCSYGERKMDGGTKNDTD